MPRVPTYDQNQVELQPLRAPRLDSVVTPELLNGGAVKQQAELGAALQKSGAQGMDIVQRVKERDDADTVFRAETTLKDDYLKYEQEARKSRQGRFAKDLTDDTNKWWDEQTQKQSEALKSPEARRAFAKRATSARLASLNSVSSWEATELEKSHDDAWRADKNITISTAVQNAGSWHPSGPDVRDLQAKPDEYDASKWGTREDGSKKGNGFLGVLRNGKAGAVSSEVTIGVEINGKEMDVPSLVPTLTRSEVQQVLNLKDGERMPDSVVRKATDFAKDRIKQGKSVFAESNESQQGQAASPIDSAREEIFRLNRYQGARKGWDASTLQNENLKDTTSLHENTIKGMALVDPTAAAAYFEANKHEIDGKRHDEIGKFAKDVSANAIGNEAGQAIWKQHGPKGDNEPVSLDEMEKKAREALKGNEPALKAALSTLKEISGAFDKGSRERAAANAAAVSTAAMDPNVSVAAIRGMPEFRMLDGTKQAAMIEHIENSRYTRQQRSRQQTDQAEADMARRNNAAFLTYSDPNVLKDMSRNQVLALLPDLGRPQTEHLLAKWDSLEKGGARVIEARIDNDDFNHVAQGAGLKPFAKKSDDEKAALGELKFRVETIIDVEQSKAKRPLTRDEKMQIFQREIDNKVLVDEWGRDPTKSAILLTPKELQNAYVMVDGTRVDLAKIPAVDRVQIIKARQARNLPVTEQAIAQTWLRANAKKPPKKAAPVVADTTDPKYVP